MGRLDYAVIGIIFVVCSQGALHGSYLYKYMRHTDCNKIVVSIVYSIVSAYDTK